MGCRSRPRRGEATATLSPQLRVVPPTKYSVWRTLSQPRLGNPVRRKIRKAARLPWLPVGGLPSRQASRAHSSVDKPYLLAADTGVRPPRPVVAPLGRPPQTRGSVATSQPRRRAYTPVLGQTRGVAVGQISRVSLAH